MKCQHGLLQCDVCCPYCGESSCVCDKIHTNVSLEERVSLIEQTLDFHNLKIPE